MTFPRMLRVRQTFDADRIEDVSGEVSRQLQKLRLGGKIRAGETVAITAGSRGIANIALITKTICDHVLGLGATPVIIPAMGSHGGGTAEGQREIVELYGVTEEYTGAEIRSSMETVIVDRTPQGIPVHFDRNAFECDHVIVAGRVKPHTGFAGEIESGLHKMMLIGLGKHNGAKIYHRAILDYSFREIIEAVAAVVLEKCKVLCGVAIVENAYDQTALIEGVPPEQFYEREKELLRLARRGMPRLPFDEIGLLIVDEIGKNISGSGMDTNVVGRKFIGNPDEGRDDVCCKRIFIRGLTPETHGNACGIGLAEFTNRRTVEQMDVQITRINALTGGHPTAAAVPVTFDTDREVLEAALQTVGLDDPENAKVVQISNTLHVADVLVSEAYAPQIAERSDLQIVDGPFEMEFDSDGFLLPVSAAGATLGAIQ
jgi:Lactate racemase N-terminal domain